jgi:hypothetical protein
VFVGLCVAAVRDRFGARESVSICCLLLILQSLMRCVPPVRADQGMAMITKSQVLSAFLAASFSVLDLPRGPLLLFVGCSLPLSLCQLIADSLTPRQAGQVLI